MKRYIFLAFASFLLSGAAWGGEDENGRTYPKEFESSPLPAGSIEYFKRFDKYAFAPGQEFYFGSGHKILRGGEGLSVPYFMSLELRTLDGKPFKRAMGVANSQMFPSLSSGYGVEPAGRSLIFLRVESQDAGLSEANIKLLQEFFTEARREDRRVDPKLQAQVDAFDVTPNLVDPQLSTETCIINRLSDGYEIQRTVVRIVIPDKDSYTGDEKQAAIACFYRGRAFHFGFSNVLTVPDHAIAPYSDELKDYFFDPDVVPQLPIFIVRMPYNYIGESRNEVLLKLLADMEHAYEQYKREKGSIP